MSDPNVILQDNSTPWSKSLESSHNELSKAIIRTMQDLKKYDEGTASEYKDAIVGIVTAASNEIVALCSAVSKGETTNSGIKVRTNASQLFLAFGLLASYLEKHNTEIFQEVQKEVTGIVDRTVSEFVDLLVGADEQAKPSMDGGLLLGLIKFVRKTKTGQFAQFRKASGILGKSQGELRKKTIELEKALKES